MVECIRHCNYDRDYFPLVITPIQTRAPETALETDKCQCRTEKGKVEREAETNTLSAVGDMVADTLRAPSDLITMTLSRGYGFVNRCHPDKFN